VDSNFQAIWLFLIDFRPSRDSNAMPSDRGVKIFDSYAYADIGQPCGEAREGLAKEQVTSAAFHSRP
jgi:hypothetical protein